MATHHHRIAARQNFDLDTLVKTNPPQIRRPLARVINGHNALRLPPRAVVETEYRWGRHNAALLLIEIKSQSNHRKRKNPQGSAGFSILFTDPGQDQGQNFYDHIDRHRCG
jgi:hypothetical protein